MSAPKRESLKSRKTKGHGSKSRTSKDANLAGIVVSVHGEFAKVQDGDGKVHRLRSRKQLPRLASGDRVGWRKLRGGGSIEQLHPRRSLLERTDAGGGTRPIAANLDLVAVVWAPAPPTPVTFIDRYLAHLAYNNLSVLLVGNKVDRDDDVSGLKREALRKTYSDCGYEWLDVSAKSGLGMDTLEAAISGKVCAFVGQSGVGKSSIINALGAPDAQATGRLTDDGTHGTHTTSATRLINLPSGATLIDSPGVRDIATSYLPPRDVGQGFPEMQPYVGDCKFRNCLHKLEPDCAVAEAAERGDISATRMQSYLVMLADSIQAELEWTG